MAVPYSRTGSKLAGSAITTTRDRYHQGRRACHVTAEKEVGHISALWAEQAGCSEQHTDYRMFFFSSLEVMLAFWGLQVNVWDPLPELSRSDVALPNDSHWRKRFDNLERRSHNFLRITRVLKCAEEVRRRRPRPISAVSCVHRCSSSNDVRIPAVRRPRFHSFVPTLHSSDPVGSDIAGSDLPRSEAFDGYVLETLHPRWQESRIRRPSHLTSKARAIGLESGSVSKSDPELAGNGQPPFAAEVRY